MSVSIASITVDHHENGFSIGNPTPTISWRFAKTSVKDWKQTSYEIVITRHGQDEMNQVESEESILIPWPSTPLSSREIAHIKVRAASKGSTTEWAQLTIEAGLFSTQDWSAEMITSSIIPSPDAPKPPTRFRKSFNIPSTASNSKARIYATAYGIYQLELNGHPVGDHVLAPGWQSYRHHLNYQTYDVSSLLREGDNTIGVYVGEGWYAGRLGRPGLRNLWGERLGFMGQLEVDGEVVVKSDDSWEEVQGPVNNSEIYNGETCDSNLDDPEWAAKATVIGGVDILPRPTAQLISTDAPPVRRVKEIKGIELITTPSGKTVIDFGQNLVGWVRIESDLRDRGDELVIRHAEVLERGELGTRPLRTADATDRIKLGGRTKGWEPRFTFHGFRYIEITGLDQPTLNDFTAIVIFSQMRRTGTFDCSHKGLKQLHENVIWSTLGNFVSIPTDCPQRDERLGWTGDLQVFAPTANYLFDTAGFLDGWMKDVRAEQVEFDGIPPVTVPFIPKVGQMRPHPMAIWADLVILTPWDLYTTFGEKDVLRRNYDAMVLWLERGVRRGTNGLWDPECVQYGDWLDPRAHPSFPAHGPSDTHAIANIYLVYVTRKLAEIADIIGKDSKRWTEEYARLKEEFVSEYVTSRGRLVADTQCGLALALRFGLLDGEQREHALKRLDWMVRWEGFRVSTGFAGTPIIVETLAENGLLHLAYRMLQEGHNPSWLYPVSMGATTIWERWDSMLPDGSINPGQMTSFNHYALGAIADMLHGTVAGLSSLTPGWKSALIRPQPGGTLTSASTSFDSPYGPYSVSWEIKANTLHVDISVPPNTEAKIVLPGVEEIVGSGQRKYTVPWIADERWPPKLIPGPQGLQMEDTYVA